MSKSSGRPPRRISTRARRRLADSRTGWSIFDDEFGGIPSKHAYISMPGKGHHGKTSVAVDLARRLIEFNPEVLVVYHTMDDSYDAIIPKLIASKTGLRVNDITPTLPAQHRIHAVRRFYVVHPLCVSTLTAHPAPSYAILIIR